MLKKIFFCFFFVSASAQSQAYLSKLQNGATEIIDKRTEDSKTFQNLDGSRTCVMSTYPIHDFIDGAWQEISSNQSIWLGGLQGSVYQYFYYGQWIFSQQSPTIYVGIGDYPWTSSYHRGYLRWGTDVIPDGSSIQNASFTLNQQNSNIATFKAYPVQNDPLVVQPPALWNDLGDGTKYQDMSTTNPNFVGNTSFKNDLANKLPSNWIAVGLKNDNEADKNKFCSFYYPTDLLVDYTPPNPISPQLSVSPSSWYDIGIENSKIIAINNNATSSVINYTASENDSWISLSAANGSTPGVLTITVTANYTGTVRTGHVTITATTPGVTNPTQIVTITQNFGAEIILPDHAVPNSHQYLASWRIIANDFTVSDNGNIAYVELKAGNSIRLNPGFRAAPSSSGYFRAIITSGYPNPFNKRLSIGGGDAKHDGDGIVSKLPLTIDLYQNYPNPFNPTTTLRYALKEDVQVSLKIYNLLGQEVRTLVNEKQSAGFKSVLWDGKNSEGAQVPSGIYIYRLIAGEYVKAKKMLLIK